jgi:Cft2 family RNA processing exonuclease
MEVLGGRGSLLKAGDTRIWLDSAAKSNGISLVSHAHLDHAPGRLSRVIATPETASILSLFGPHRFEKLIRYGESIVLGGVRISAHPSGHVIGSSQFLLEDDGGSLVYTGDLNTCDSVILRGARPLESDTLILEATYGSPRYIFPSREEVYAKIIRWIIETIKAGEIPAFKVYALGKAQEIIGLVNAYLKDPALASFTINRITESLSQHGFKLEHLPINSPEGLEAFKQGECVYVSSKRYSPPSRRRIRWAAATGWALRYWPSGFDAAFPLSGHADFSGLVSYAEESGARRIYLTHGFAEGLAKHLRKRGLHAEALSRVP